MKVRILSEYSNFHLEHEINKFTHDDNIIVIDIKYLVKGDVTIGFIHYYEKSDLRKMKLEKLVANATKTV